MWCQQEMDLGEEDDGVTCGGRGEILPCLFYGEAANELDVGWKGDENCPNPHKCHMDCPGSVAPDEFVGGVDLDG
jgi:hypothetical protein